MKYKHQLCSLDNVSQLDEVSRQIAVTFFQTSSCTNV